MYYLCATTATEHRILAFIRWQNAKANAVRPALRMPTHLKAWICHSRLDCTTRQTRSKLTDGYQCRRRQSNKQ